MGGRGGGGGEGGGEGRREGGREGGEHCEILQCCRSLFGCNMLH